MSASVLSRLRTAAAPLAFFAASVFATPALAQVYWRIDTGVSRPRDAGFKDNDYNAAGNICANPPGCTEGGTLNKISSAPIAGAGVGYRLAGGLRGDVTLVYRGLYLNDATSEANYVADIRSLALMANGYYDFTVGGVKPYIGAGVGRTRNRMDPLQQDFRLGFYNTFAGATRYDDAVAFMAGVGIPYGKWTLDLGYRYIDLGKIGTGTTAAFGITSGHSGKLSAHEITLGVRF